MQLIIFISSLLGFIIETVSYHFDKKKYLICCLWATLFFSIPYALTSAGSGLVINVGGGIRDIFAYYEKPLGICTIGMIAVNLFFFDSLGSLIPIVCVLMHNTALKHSEQVIRASIVVEQLLGFAYDLKYGLFLLCLMNLFNICSSCVALYKNRSKKASV